MKLLLVVTSLLLVGCSSINNISRVNIGMTKDDVMAVMGEPKSVSAKDKTEYLNYDMYDAWTDSWEHYFVRLRSGSVDSYGKIGDFDSTKDPTININQDIRTNEKPTEINIKSEQTLNK